MTVLSGCLESDLGDGAEICCPECFKPTAVSGSVDSVLPALAVASPSAVSAKIAEVVLIPSRPALLATDPTACSVCYTDFADEPRSVAPRRLGCGHVMCTGETLPGRVGGP